LADRDEAEQEGAEQHPAGSAAMKIYTRTGDAGQTGLIGGARVGKDDARLECYGTVDELNTALGAAAVVAPQPIRERLLAVQNELFVIGSRLAAPEGAPQAASLPQLPSPAIERLEGEIDLAEQQLPPLKQFILPGGAESAARLHVARTVCRRAERLMVALARAVTIEPMYLIYLNRLSDWLFVHARLANHIAGVEDVPWRK
jgi:cob(I)alamin adenosyltransferase